MVFFKNIHFKIKIFFLLTVLIFIIIILKVLYIQVIKYDKLNNLANDLWSRNLPIEGDRGNIYDSNGNILAGNNTTISLVLIPNQIKEKEKAV